MTEALIFLQNKTSHGVIPQEASFPIIRSIQERKNAYLNSTPSKTTELTLLMSIDSKKNE